MRGLGRAWTAAAVVALAIAWPGVARAQGWTALVVGDETLSNAVAPIATATDTARPVIPVGNNPFDIAVGADGSSAYVADFNSNGGGTDGVTLIDLAQSPPATSFVDTAPFQPLGLALTPDGRALYAVNGGGEIEKLDLTTSPPTVGAPFSDGTSDGAGEIAISPDGQTAWVTDGPEGQVTPINLSNDQPGAPIKVGSGPYGTCNGASGSGPGPFGVGVSPDGSKVFVADNGSSQLSVIDTADGAVRNVSLNPSAGAGGGAITLAVSPSGSTVYVAQPCADDVVPVSMTGSPHALAPIPITFPDNTGNPFPYAIAITPDGRHLYVGDGYFGGGHGPFGDQVVDVPLPAGSPQTVIDSGAGTLRSAVVTPDQAPIANFTVSAAPAGQATSFDASSSTDSTSAIASYTWSFGDGSTATSTAPTITHVYQSAGTFTATVTETDAAGTSTAPVFTGQSMLQNGGPSAQASKSVIVTATAVPQPAASLSTASVSFGTVGVGQQSAAQVVTVTNTGQAPLQIASAALAGGGAGDFKLASDTCGGQTIQPGASCSTQVLFTPTTAGPLSATLAYTDNSSGSPHTVALAGIGDTHGTVSGEVQDDHGGPVAGAAVQICPHGQLSVSSCQYTITGAGGTYSFSGLAPGSWAMQVASPVASLYGAAAIVTVAPGPQSQDFTLAPPAPLPAGVTYDGQSGGNPVSYWMSPSVTQDAVYAPSGQPEGQLGVTMVSFAEQPAGGAGQSAASSSGGLLVFYMYDQQGVPRFLSMEPVAGSPGEMGSWSTGLADSPTVGVTDVRSLSAQGVLTPYAQPFHGAAQSWLYQWALTLGQPPAGLAARAARGDGSFHADGQPDNSPGSASGGPPPSAFSGPFNDGFKAVQGVVNSGQLLIPQIQQAVQNVIANLQQQAAAAVGAAKQAIEDEIERLKKWLDDLKKQREPTTFKPTVCDEPVPIAGEELRIQEHERLAHRASAREAQSCTLPPPPDQGDEWDPYVDPSGVVVTTRGVPVPSARVLLTRSGTPGGRLSLVPNGSIIMSSSNRRNPSYTTALGQFGWDVLAGYYQVDAEHRGCTAAHRRRLAHTRLFPVPPPVGDLRLVLRCPRLRRSATHVRLEAVRVPISHLVLIARVVGRRPSGLMRFFRGRRLLGTVPLMHARAELTVRGRSTRGIRAVYEGDGHNLPSRASATANHQRRTSRGRHRR